MADEKVMLGHGSGGSMMKRIIDEVFFEAYGTDELLRGDDAAVLPALAPGERIAYSTDSFVVTPHFFPGGDIGRLAVCGTVNDVATSGAPPRCTSPAPSFWKRAFPWMTCAASALPWPSAAREAGVTVRDRRHQGGEPRPRRRRVSSTRAAWALLRRGRELGRRAMQARRRGAGERHAGRPRHHHHELPRRA